MARNVRLISLLMLGVLCTCDRSRKVTHAPMTCCIVVSDDATAAEKIACRELADYLDALYKDVQFTVGNQASPKAQTIYVGTPTSAPFLSKHLGTRPLEGPESYVVTMATIGGRKCGLIIGADRAGVAYGVYAILKQLGYGFYLGFETRPEPKDGTLTFDAWALSDRPLVPTRLMFNWHNFLSGCSTWNAEHWQKWIAQSQKMGANAIMVHAYGNNPMAGYAFQGVPKPVGYISSTRIGRDWSTNHVNDVRRLYGGHVFDRPVFGSVASVEGSDEDRTDTAQRFMSQAFDTAEQRGVEVYFAVDVDTTSANPQVLIGALPETARFEIDVPGSSWNGRAANKAWLANPDTPEGYELYKAQVKGWIEAYPQIDCLVVWHRRRNTPWTDFRFANMPQAWQDQYEEEIAKTPQAANLSHAHHLFGIAKIVRAFQRALNELGHVEVRIALGSWDFDFLPAADRFLPADVTLIPLDWLILRDQSIFATAERRALVARVAAHRPVIPIAWAHHDDGNYVGRPYTPPSHFFDHLTEMKCDTAGFGMIHWTTKPLDLYFENLLRQVWAGTKNEALNVTCGNMATHLVGPEPSAAFGDYLHAWITTMPTIGRESSDFFIDHELTDVCQMEEAQRKRLQSLDVVDRSKLSSQGQAWYDYFLGLEQYMGDIRRTEARFNRAKRQWSSGDLQAARATMAECQPEKVIEQFAEFSQRGGLTRGEQGLIVTMNTRWLPHYLRFRQMLGIESVRYNFSSTSHDPLAQQRGVFTFHFDSDGKLWQCLGAEETGGTVWTRPASLSFRGGEGIDRTYDEIGRDGIESDKPLRFRVQPILTRNDQERLKTASLPPGEYELTLLTFVPEAIASGDAVLDVSIRSTGTDAPLVTDRVDLVQRAGGNGRILALTYAIEQTKASTLEVTLTPREDKVRICGAILSFP